jgi:hypothetical protein
VIDMGFKFSVSMGQPPLAGFLIYSRNEYSFRFIADSPVDVSDRVGEGGVATLSIGNLQLEMAVATGQLLFVWGYDYFGRWSAGHLEHLEPTDASVFARGKAPWERDMAIGIADAPGWPVVQDFSSGWLRYGGGQPGRKEKRYTIATDVVIGLSGSSLSSLWLRPEYED